MSNAALPVIGALVGPVFGGWDISGRLLSVGAIPPWLPFTINRIGQARWPAPTMPDTELCPRGGGL